MKIFSVPVEYNNKKIIVEVIKNDDEILGLEIIDILEDGIGHPKNVLEEVSKELLNDYRTYEYLDNVVNGYKVVFGVQVREI